MLCALDSHQGQGTTTKQTKERKVGYAGTVGEAVEPTAGELRGLLRALCPAGHAGRDRPVHLADDDPGADRCLHRAERGQRAHLHAEQSAARAEPLYTGDSRRTVSAEWHAAAATAAPVCASGRTTRDPERVRPAAANLGDLFVALRYAVTVPNPVDLTNTARRC